MKKRTIEKKEKNKQKVPKDISQEILKKVFQNILKGICVMLYFIILNIAYGTIEEGRLIGDIEVFAGAFLILGIYTLEKAYKKDSGTKAISAIELLVLSFHSLTIMHFITFYKYRFQFYLLTSSYVFAIYYILKSIIIYTKGRKTYLNSLSDISDIIKEEPVKKEAKKRNEEETDKKVEVKANKKQTKVDVKEKLEETKKGTKNKKLEETKEENEEQLEEKPKKKRGRPKKEEKKDD